MFVSLTLSGDGLEAFFTPCHGLSQSQTELSTCLGFDRVKSLSKVSVGTGSLKRISHKTLASMPQFICFDTVELSYQSGSQKMAKKCRLFTRCLEPLKTALDRAHLLRFTARISGINQSIFVRHLSDELLPICGSFHCYEFSIHLVSGQNSGTMLIASILQLPAIVRCTKIGIELKEQAITLPVDTISDWLNRKSDNEGKYNGQKSLLLDGLEILNAREMCDHLKKVYDP